MSIEQGDYNRIVLVGNGFDLALRLETSYSNFILDLYKDTVREYFGQELGKYSNGLVTITNQNNVMYQKDIELHLGKLDSFTRIQEIFNDLTPNFYVTEDDTFLSDIIIQNESRNWVDIEAFYFKSIKSAYLKSDGGLSFPERVTGINRCMLALEQRLKVYIRKKQDELPFDSRQSHLYHFFEQFYLPINWSNHDQKVFLERTHGGPQDLEKRPDNVLFLNFNYTNTVQKFREAFRSQLVGDQEIQIHGSVNDYKNPIIFGYGDDTTDLYRDMEQTEYPEYMERIKSFQYGRTHNYDKLLGFLEDGMKFEVFIVGHSCGLSDKTMLKTIFEHENCMLIKNFHHGKEAESNEFEKRVAVSRHFDDKIKMREVLSPFDSNASFPSS